MPTAPLKSLSTVAWAQLLVFVDFRIDGVDLIPDPLGWLISAIALGSLAGLNPGFRVASIACFVAILPSAPEMFGAENEVLDVLITIATTVLIFATCSGVMGSAPALHGSANALRWADLWATCAMVPLMLAVESDEDLEALVVLAVVAMLGLFVWFLVLLFRASRAPGGVPRPAGAPAPR